MANPGKLRKQFYQCKGGARRWTMVALTTIEYSLATSLSLQSSSHNQGGWICLMWYPVFHSVISYTQPHTKTKFVICHIIQLTRWVLNSIFKFSLHSLTRDKKPASFQLVSYNHFQHIIRSKVLNYDDLYLNFYTECKRMDYLQHCTSCISVWSLSNVALKIV